MLMRRLSGWPGAVQIAACHNLTDQYFRTRPALRDAVARSLNSASAFLSAILLGALHAGGSTMQSARAYRQSGVRAAGLILFLHRRNFSGLQACGLPAGRVPERRPPTPCRPRSPRNRRRARRDDKGTALKPPWSVMSSSAISSG